MEEKILEMRKIHLQVILLIRQNEMVIKLSDDNTVDLIKIHE